MKRILASIMALSIAAITISSCSGSGSAASDTGLNNPSIQNIMARKSVRAYTDQKVTKEQMDVMLKAAMAAPSGMDIRPWSFIVLEDSSKYEEIFSKANFNLGRFMDASAVVIFCADTTVARQPQGAPAPVVMPNGTWRDDMGACTENFLLAAESLGLGAVWTAAYPYHDRMDPIRASLNLPSNVVPYCVVPVGYPEGETQPKDKFDASRIHYERW